MPPKGAMKSPAKAKTSGKADAKAVSSSSSQQLQKAVEEEISKISPRKGGKKKKEDAPEKEEVNVVWFRRNLRMFHDNPALIEACKAGKPIICMYILTPYAQPKSHKKKRQKLQGTGIISSSGPVDKNASGNSWFQFLFSSLKILQANLRAYGQNLYIFHETEPFCFRMLLETFAVDTVFCEQDLEPYGIQRDDVVSSMCQNFDTKFVSYASGSLYDVREMFRFNDKEKQNGGEAQKEVPSSIGHFAKLAQKMCPKVAPARWTDADISNWKSGKKSISYADEYKKEINYFYTVDHGKIPPPPKGCEAEPFVSLGFATIPNLKDLRLSSHEEIPSKFHGGEEEGLKRLEYFLHTEPERVLNYDRRKMNPILRDSNFRFYPSSLGVSPYLALGCLSPRTLFSEVQKLWEAHKRPGMSQVVENLIWRDYFMTCGFGIENYGAVKENKILRPLPWEIDQEALRRWEQGKTGFPFIDAIMNQLRSEGWVHHFLRQVVACFLTRGNLYQKWTMGRDVFQKYAIDNHWSLSSNTGGWIMASCSCYDDQFQNVFSPVEIGKQYDPTGDYVRYYVPQLRRMPQAYIYEPWDAPLEIQEAAGCVIGRNYPPRIAYHEETSRINFELSKKCFEKPITRDWSFRKTALEYVRYQQHHPSWVTGERADEMKPQLEEVAENDTCMPGQWLVGVEKRSAAPRSPSPKKRKIMDQDGSEDSAEEDDLFADSPKEGNKKKSMGSKKNAKQSPVKAGGGGKGAASSKNEPKKLTSKDVPRWNENRFSKKKDVPRWNEDQFDGLDSMEGDANLIDNDAAPLFNKRVNRLTAANAALKDMKMTIEDVENDEMYDSLIQQSYPAMKSPKKAAMKSPMKAVSSKR